MKKLMLVLIVALFMLSACGGEKYADLKALAKEHIADMQKLMDVYNNTKSAEEVAAALNELADKKEDYKEKVQKLMAEKYSRERERNETPEELKPLNTVFLKTYELMNLTLFRIEADYAGDPGVQAALRRLQSPKTIVRDDDSAIQEDDSVVREDDSVAREEDKQ